MYNCQADGLSHALLSNYNSKLYSVAFVPMSFKKSELSSLGVSDIIEIGAKLPKLFIYKKSTVVGQARLGQVDGQNAVIISAKERIVDTGKPEPKSVVLECRFAIIPKDKFIVSRLVRIPAQSTEHILLFVKKKLIATARLVETNGVFALQIKETF